MTKYFDNRLDRHAPVMPSNTPEIYLGDNLRGAAPKQAIPLALPQELFVVTRTTGKAPGDVSYWGRGLTAEEASRANKTGAHLEACNPEGHKMTNWLEVPSGTPVQFKLQGRELERNPWKNALFVGCGCETNYHPPRLIQFEVRFVDDHGIERGMSAELRAAILLSDGRLSGGLAFINPDRFRLRNQASNA